MAQETNETSIYMVPGPTKSVEYFHGKSVPGGWGYTLANIANLDRRNPTGIKELILGTLDSWGEPPELPKVQNFSVTIHNVSRVCEGKIDELEPSHQHASVLNALLATNPPTSRFYSILDPDCYLLLENALTRITEHMTVKGLAAFGVPYPPTRFNHQNTPTAFFSVFDKEFLTPKEANFLPPENMRIAKHPMGSKRLIKVIRHLRKGSFDAVEYLALILAPASRSFTAFFFLFHQLRFGVGTRTNQALGHDTGFRVLAALEEKKLRFEVAKNCIEDFGWRVGFNTREYLRLNPDVLRSNLDPTWHFLLFGIFQNRDFGKQNFLWKIIICAARPKHSYGAEVFDASSLEAGIRLVSIRRFRYWKKFIFGDQYNWNQRPLAIHLSSYGKNGDGRDFHRLELLLGK